MARAVICKGDPTSHGGKVLEGNEDATIDGRPIALRGHRTYCPRCKGEFPISEGVDHHSFAGIGTALEGMKTACGATLIATQHSMTVDDQSSAGDLATALSDEIVDRMVSERAGTGIASTIGPGHPSNPFNPLDFAAEPMSDSGRLDFWPTEDLNSARTTTSANVPPPARRLPENPLIVPEGQLTFDAEGNDITTSPYFSRRLHWPGGASGVTIGRGYDMRYKTEDIVRQDLVNSGMEVNVAELYAQGAGLSGEAARDFVTANRRVFDPMTREVQQRLFADYTYPVYQQGAEDAYTRSIGNDTHATAWRNLDGRIRDVAVDLYYQQGSLYNSQLQAIQLNNRTDFATVITNDNRTNQYEPSRGRPAYLRGGL